MRRPLLVFTGQGIALADGFSLTRLLQQEPTLTECFRVHGAAFPDDLDHVFSQCGPAGRPAFDRLIQKTREVCIARRATAATLVNQAGFFRLLAEVSRQRPVLHLTTNIDGLSTELAVDHGALWRPLVERCGIDRIVLDLRTTLDAGSGFLHIPVHGEAGLLAAGDGAPTLWTVRRLGEGPGGNSTLHEGLGRDVIRIEGRMIASQLGYRLLLGLLTGEAVRLDSGHCLGPYPLADLVVVGYGARGTEPRCRYPFETRIVEALVARRPLYPPARTAVLFEKSDPDVVGWYHQNGFNVAPHGEFDLVTTVRRVISA